MIFKGLVWLRELPVNHKVEIWILISFTLLFTSLPWVLIDIALIFFSFEKKEKWKWWLGFCHSCAIHFFLNLSDAKGTKIRVAKGPSYLCQAHHKEQRELQEGKICPKETISEITFKTQSPYFVNCYSWWNHRAHFILSTVVRKQNALFW